MLAENMVQIKMRLAEIIPNVDFYFYSSPIFMLVIGALAALLVGIFRAHPDKPNFTSLGIAIVSCVGGLIAPLLVKFNANSAFLGSGFLADGLSLFSFFIISAGTLFTLLLASGTNTGRSLLRPETIALLLFSSSGMMIMTSAGEFMSFFIGLEITSISLYVLVGYQRSDVRGLEAAVKYFLLGSCAAGMILMGMALIYLHTGSLRWSDIGHLPVTVQKPFASLGIVLLVCGLAFKLAIAPFHTWAPDVYQGAHSTLTGYMATLVKLSIVVVFIRIVGTGFKTPAPLLVDLFWGLGALSIIVGSLFGLVHNSIKRILAYSSVANAGYFCLALAALAANPTSILARQALMAHAVVYVILSLGIFAVLSWIEEGNREDLLKEELAGLAAKSPFLATALSFFLAGLAGIPPLAGFFAKFMIINAAISEQLIGLSIVLVVFSCLSLYYYLSIMVEVWFKPATRQSAVLVETNGTTMLRFLVATAMVAALVFGIAGPRWASSLHYVTAVEKVSQK